MINMKDDKFDPKTNRDLLNQNQKSFMSDSVDDGSKDKDGLFSWLTLK